MAEEAAEGPVGAAMGDDERGSVGAFQGRGNGSYGAIHEVVLALWVDDARFAEIRAGQAKVFKDFTGRVRASTLFQVVEYVYVALSNQNSGRFKRSAQRAGEDSANIESSHHRTLFLGLFAATLIDQSVGVTLKLVQAIEVGLAVSDEVELFGR